MSMLRAAWFLVAVMAAEPRGPEATGEQAALARVPAAFADDAVVLAWSNRAFEAARTDAGALPFKSVHANALMHLAMHDALNAVVPVYRGYAFPGQDPAAHPVVAAAQAAHDVLLAQYPTAAAAVDDELARSLAPIAEGRPKRRGLALGKAAAAAVLRARRGDGWDQVGTYTFTRTPGAYQSTPGFDGFVLQPGFARARPFALDDVAALRTPPPPLASAAYAAAFAEVKAVGRVDSRTRTADQTGYAIWWMEFAETSFVRLARTLAAEQRMHAWRAARLFALLNVGLYDGYVAVWDAKFAHAHWRPYTAIRQAAADGNPVTEPDPTWEPLRPTPPFPEAPSAHATGCSVSAAVLARFFGAGLPFTLRTTTAPPGMPTRRFTSFAAAAAECADSRVQLGWHFRHATDAGLALGSKVAAQVLARALGPR
jgi:hypothetical protein